MAPLSVSSSVLKKEESTKYRPLLGQLRMICHLFLMQVTEIRQSCFGDVKDGA